VESVDHVHTLQYSSPVYLVSIFDGVIGYYHHLLLAEILAPRRREQDQNLPENVSAREHRDPSEHVRKDYRCQVHQYIECLLYQIVHIFW